jgi:hypothetical protein
MGCDNKINYTLIGKNDAPIAKTTRLLNIIWSWLGIIIFKSYTYSQNQSNTMHMRIPKFLLTTACIFIIASSGKAQQWHDGSNGAIYNTSGNVAVGNISNPLYPITIGKDGSSFSSFGKNKFIRLMVNEGNQTGGGIAVSDDGGFFDWNDGYVTFEPLCCASGFKVNGDLCLGDQSDNLGYGKKLDFGINSGSDPLWLSRYIVAQDATEMRVNVGDEGGPADRFVIGYTWNGTWNPGMFISSTGYVGIGTNDTKGYRFAVNGDAIFNKVKVMAYPWADYVFNANYRLRPLSEVEQYIKQHHHLPEVPTAEEVEKNGLDVGDNQATLLKKIEELTLYMIDQNKMLQQLNKSVKVLQEENNSLKKLMKSSEKRK